MDTFYCNTVLKTCNIYIFGLRTHCETNARISSRPDCLKQYSKQPKDSYFDIIFVYF